MMKHLIPIILCLLACTKTPSKPDDVVPTDNQIYMQTVQHVLTHVSNGYVITLKPDGQPEAMGEGLLFAGEFLWAAPCIEGKAVSEAIAGMITRMDGQLVRYEPLGEYEGGREMSVDGAIVLYKGIARRIMDCGESQLWSGPIDLHYKFLKSHSWRLHANVGDDLKGLGHDFTLPLDLIRWRLGQDGEPSGYRMYQLEHQAAVWALSLHPQRRACYRVNLGWSSVISAEVMGWPATGKGRDEICLATRGMDIPTVDHWCARTPIDNYLSNYVIDEWQYRHQRCGAWEFADGNGNNSHRLDLLDALVLKHGWQGLQAL